MTTDRTDALLIALNWGTSSLRAYLLGDSGAILAETSLPLGIMQLQQHDSDFDRSRRHQAFDSAFEQAVGSWLETAPSLPILASGMIASAQGWCEAPYLPVPVDLGELSKHLTQLTTSRGRLVYIVPGLIRYGDIVSVMRGEETEILGALDVIGRSPHANLLIGLPGTHSKWARVSASVVEHFETFMTGEVYAALCEHTILAQTMKRASSFFVDAFDRGVQVAMSPAGDLGLLSNIFSVRTLALTNKLTAEEQPDYLSGLLIGHEINALSRLHKKVRSSRKNLPPVLLIGDASLCARYERALELQHFEIVKTVTDAAARGLWQIALQASLIPATQPSSTVNPDRSKRC